MMTAKHTAKKECGCESKKTAGKRHIGTAFSRMIGAAFLSLAVCAAQPMTVGSQNCMMPRETQSAASLSEEPQAGVRFSVSAAGLLTAENTSSVPQSFTFIFTRTDADGRLSDVRVECIASLESGVPTALSVAAEEDTLLSLDPMNNKDAVFYGKLYAFDEKLSPVSEPVPVYLIDNNTYIDVGGLLH